MTTLFVDDTSSPMNWSYSLPSHHSGRSADRAVKTVNEVFRPLVSIKHHSPAGGHSLDLVWPDWSSWTLGTGYRWWTQVLASLLFDSLQAD